MEIEGLTGEIRFTDDGRRQNYTLHVVEMTVNSAMVKVAEWSDETGFTPVAPKYVRLKPTAHIERNRTYVVTTIVVSYNLLYSYKSQESETESRHESLSSCNI